MSFRLFIYYCALVGGGGAFLGWALGRWLAPSEGMVGQGIKGMWLGVGVALALGVLDAVWNASRYSILFGSLRVLTALVVGGLGGLFGALVGQALFDLMEQSEPFRVVGWTLLGLLIGASLGVFDLLESLLRGQSAQGAWRKIRNGVLGGTFGGLLGGILFIVLLGVWSDLFKGKERHLLWSPTVSGFLALGASIGLLIALAQVILKEAWLRVEAGFRAGRELILSRPETTLGRAESCDVGLFGDPAIAPLHARIIRRGRDYVLEDSGSSTGTYLNGERIEQPRLLHSGDAIGLGQCLLRFGDRQKRK